MLHRLFAIIAIVIGSLPAPNTTFAQDTGLLRITVTLIDADGASTPIPRVVMLVSDNPSTGEPRRIRTGPDGAAELKLRPGNYTVESDQPVTLGGQAYTWTQIIDVTAGADVTLALTPQNAEIEAATTSTAGGTPSMRADAAALLNKWRSSVVEIWTPTAHASGFLISKAGLIATDYRAIGDTTSVEVEFTSSASSERDRSKFAGSVVTSDRAQGVSIVWIAPAAVTAIQPVPIRCGGSELAPVEYDDRIVALAAPMLEPKEGIPGTVERATAQSFEPDWRLAPGTAGGPVFDADGRVIGITIADQEDAGRRRDGSHVLPVGNICKALAEAEKEIAGATPPAATPLPVERAIVTATRKPPDPKAPRPQPATIASSDFDISLMVPSMLMDAPTMTGPRRDFGNWQNYVTAASGVLLVRISPQFEESFWKTIARGAAYTQGIALPPLRSFNANFLSLRAYCGNVEVAPIHPFLIESRVSEKDTIREGLYVFGLTDFTDCDNVRFDLFSAKAPNKADSRSIDPKLFTQMAGYGR